MLQSHPLQRKLTFPWNIHGINFRNIWLLILFQWCMHVRQCTLILHLFRLWIKSPIKKKKKKKKKKKRAPKREERSVKISPSNWGWIHNFQIEGAQKIVYAQLTSRAPKREERSPLTLIRPGGWNIHPLDVSRDNFAEIVFRTPRFHDFFLSSLAQLLMLFS